MPYKPARQCRIPFCPNLTHDPSGFCDVHADHRGIQRGIERRPSSSRRGYDHEWRKIREEVLTTAGIPREQWPLYDIDHKPCYDPSIDPDHRHYTLTPRLHGDHSRKTIREDGGLGHAIPRGVSQSLTYCDIYRSGYPMFHTTDSQGKGVGHV